MINNPNTIIFDCDGVILKSNQVKKQAYYKVALSYYGDELAKSLIEYLSENTGNPREHFFKHFLMNIVPSEYSGPSVEEIVAEVSKEIVKGLMECEISQSIFALRDKFPDSKWFVVSGGVEKELRDVFCKRSLDELFDGGIFGGPMTKDQILKSLIEQDLVKFPVIFLGDSRYDYEVATRFNLDFIFISNWTDFKDWQNYCVNNKITYVRSLNNFL